MTKSFTASSMLALRDAGLFRLDDPVNDFVPELRGYPGVTDDSPAISLRHLLTMTAGFPTDDPWGDRQQGTPLPDFAAILARGVRSAWAPGTRFEYSNLGYAVLGRVISAAAQAEYPDFVRARVLDPLGLSRTGFEAAEFDPDGLARGYARGADGWTELTPDPLGAFAPMGGVFSCVRDLARSIPFYEMLGFEKFDDNVFEQGAAVWDGLGLPEGRRFRAVFMKIPGDRPRPFLVVGEHF